MPFLAERSKHRVADVERGWEMTAQHSMDVTNFRIVHVSSAHVVFTAKRIPWKDPLVERNDGYATEWQITAVGHKPADEMQLTETEQHALIVEAMSAYGFGWGEGAGAALLRFR